MNREAIKNESRELIDSFTLANLEPLGNFRKIGLTSRKEWHNEVPTAHTDNIPGETTPRTSYARKKQRREELSLKLLTNLDSARMASIKDQFKGMQDSVNMVEFVTIMECHLPDYIYNTGFGPGGGDVPRNEVIANLVELFREVDINGDGMMEWEEFTRFIVEKAQLYHSLQAIEELPPYRHAHRSVEDISRHHHKNPIEKLCFLKNRSKKKISSKVQQSSILAPSKGKLTQPEKVAVLEQLSPMVTVYNARNWSKLAELQHKAVPLSLAFVEDYNLLATCCADMNMVLWNLDEGQRTRHYVQLAKWPAQHAQMSMVWSRAHKLLYSGSTTGEICAWDLKVDQEKDNSPVLVREKCLNGHTDIVMDMIMMDSMNSLVSASLDSTIQIWDTYTGKLCQKLIGHKKGVFALSYSEQYRCLVSAGFDHEAYVWSPFVSSKLATLKGHHASLVGCQCVENGHEIITADASGIFKVWDLRNFSCRGTFTSEPDPNDVTTVVKLSTFVHMTLPPIKPNQELEDYRLVAATRKLIYFDQERQRNEPVTDDQPISCCCYNSNSLTILTATERSVKIWDAIFGNMKRIFRDVTEADITAVCLDDRQRKFIVGDAVGNLSVHNYQNGALMKTLAPFDLPKPVIGLQYCKGHRSILAASADKTVRVYDEMDPEKCIILQEFHESRSFQHKRDEDLNSVAYSHYMRLVATGSTNPADESDGVIIWDFDLGKGQMSLRSKDEDFTIQSMEFLGAYPLLLCACSDGILRLWGVERAKCRGQCILKVPNEKLKEDYLDESLFQNISDLATGGIAAHASFSTDGTGKASPILSLAFDPVNECVYSGDESGALKKWDFREVIRQLEEEKVKSPRIVPGNIRNTVIKSSFSRTQGQAPREMLTASLVGLTWGLHAAHDGAVEQVTLVEEQSVMSASQDRTVKIWSIRGEAMGTLLQGLPFNTHSPHWDLKVDVLAREAQEVEDISSIIHEVNAKIEEQKRLMFSEDDVSWMDRISQTKSYRQLHRQTSSYDTAGHHHRKGRKNPFHRRIQNSQRLLESLEQEDKNLMALQGSKHTTSLPALEFEMGHFEDFPMGHHSDHSLGSRSFSSMSSLEQGSLNPEHRRRARARRKKLPTIVPPSPGRKKGEVGPEIISKMDNLQNLLNNWEAKQGTQKFAGKVSGLKDFLKIEEPDMDDESTTKDLSKSSEKMKATTMGKTRSNGLHRQRIGYK